MIFSMELIGYSENKNMSIMHPFSMHPAFIRVLIINCSSLLIVPHFNKSSTLDSLCKLQTCHLTWVLLSFESKLRPRYRLLRYSLIINCLILLKYLSFIIFFTFLRKHPRSKSYSGLKLIRSFSILLQGLSIHLVYHLHLRIRRNMSTP